MIKINGLNKFFNKGKQNEIHVINNITLDLPDRGMVAIFGKSGCGKTTLLNVIGGLDTFAGGSLTIEGKDIGKDTDAIRNEYIGYIFQNYNLNKTESCFDNVADALRLCGMEDEREIEARVMAALSNVGMAQYRKRTPDTLSGGQQQRIAIARAIVKNPRIILADEPTGNLDEANTVMIMDLLKAISRDHLVLLVTHEANLVDFYCETVIELSDGKVIGTKTNHNATGFTARDKNDIYLGELDKTTLEDCNAQVEYYGSVPASPIKLKIINNGGKLYVQIDSEKVQILDSASEIKLREGKYEEIKSNNEISSHIDMSKLPPVKGTRFGHLFNLRSAVKSGYRANFPKKKRGNAILRNCMLLFAAVLVMSASVFGTSFESILKAKDSYNHNVFYVYTPDTEVLSKLQTALNENSAGIDSLHLVGRYLQGDDSFHLRGVAFETFNSVDYDQSFKTNAVFLDAALIKDKKLLVGKKDDLALDEVVISSQVADALLENATLGYVNEYKDLLGMLSTRFTINGKNPYIAGVVEVNEPAVYISATALALYNASSGGQLYVRLDSVQNTEVAPGETTMILRQENVNTKYPKLNETIKIHGVDVKVTKIIRFISNYSEWLQSNNIVRMKEETYFHDLVKREYPDLTPQSEAFLKKVDELSNQRYFEYYDYYYDRMDDFLENYYHFENSFEIWLAVEKGIFEAKLMVSGMDFPEEYYIATKYKETHGVYPYFDQIEALRKNYPDYKVFIDECYRLYEEEFYRGSKHEYNYLPVTYLLDEIDYVKVANSLGETHPSALPVELGVSEGTQYKEAAVAGARASVSVDYVYYQSPVYAVLHSNNPKATQAFIEEHFSNLEPPFPSGKAVFTPDEIYSNLMARNFATVTGGLITMAVILALMCICMFFIMRSSLMNRMKEVGICRAIGVSKKNLIFKFFVESLVLTTLTILIGYLASSAFLGICFWLSPAVEYIFYYPVWLALAVLIILYAVSILFGILPISLLLRKTPSQIMAKYDI